MQGSGGIRAENNTEAWNEQRLTDIKFPAHWNKPDVRGVLYAMQWRVCAYCGRTLSPEGDRGDVEHFRPKGKVADAPDHGGYWWLAYSLPNYLLSCRVCNRNRKGTKFPLRGAARRATYQTRRTLSREARALWLPTADRLENWLRVDLDDPLLQIVAADGLRPTEHLIVTESLHFFRINVDTKLINQRKSVRKQVERALDQNDEKEAQELAGRYRPQSLVARAVLEQRGVALPDPALELEVVLEDLFMELDTIRQVLEKDPKDKQTLRERDEAHWCLAALLTDPVDGDHQRIVKFCSTLGLLESVQGKLSLLESSDRS